MNFLDKILGYFKKSSPAKEGIIEMESGAQISQGGVDGAEISDNSLNKLEENSSTEESIPPLVKEDSPIESEQSSESISIKPEPIKKDILSESQEQSVATKEFLPKEPEKTSELNTTPSVNPETSIEVEDSKIQAKPSISQSQAISTEHQNNLVLTKEDVVEKNSKIEANPENTTKKTVSIPEEIPTANVDTTVTETQNEVSKINTTEKLLPTENIPQTNSEKLVEKPVTSIEELEKKMKGPVPDIKAQEGGPAEPEDL